MRSGGQLLVECLRGLGGVKAFGVPGESYLAVLDALHDATGKLDFVLCRNETSGRERLKAFAGAVLDLAISAEAITLRQTLSRIGRSAIAAKEQA